MDVITGSGFIPVLTLPECAIGEHVDYCEWQLDRCSNCGSSLFRNYTDNNETHQICAVCNCRLGGFIKKEECIYEIKYKRNYSFGHSSYFSVIIKSTSDEIIEIANNLYKKEDILLDLLEIRQIELQMNAEPKLIKSVYIERESDND